MSLGRREFVRVSVGATLVGGSMIAGVTNAQAGNKPVQNDVMTVLDPNDWASVRAQFKLSPEFVHISNFFLASTLSLLILGMAFGGARVHIRVAIACRYSEAAVGLCVSRANALATPVLLLILSLQLAMIENAWLLPFLLVTLSAALLLQTSATRFARGQADTAAAGA